MNLRQLEAFRAVMSTGSATRAGEMLRISQPAISQLVAQLERNSGLTLFTRRGGRMTPTWEAATLFAEVDKAFLGVERIERVIAGLRDHNWGQLNIASFPGLVRRLLPDILSAYGRDHPEVEIALDVRRARDLPEMVLMRQADLAITLAPSEREDIESTLIGTAAAVCILPAGHKLGVQAVVHARDLDGEAFVSLGRHDYWRHAVDRVFGDCRVERRLRIEAAQTEAICSFVANGCGVAVVDPISLYKLHNPAIIVRAFEPVVLFDLWMLAPGGMARPRLIEHVEAFIKSRLDDFLRSLRTSLPTELADPAREFPGIRPTASHVGPGPGAPRPRAGLVRS